MSSLILVPQKQVKLLIEKWLNIIIRQAELSGYEVDFFFFFFYYRKHIKFVYILHENGLISY